MRYEMGFDHRLNPARYLYLDGTLIGGQSRNTAETDVVAVPLECFPEPVYWPRKQERRTVEKAR